MKYDTTVVDRILENVPLPKMVRVRQKFDSSHIENISVAVRTELMRSNISDRVKPGMKIAVSCGSRGVANINLILKEIVAVLNELGAEPFIFPAMGSHGGATAVGQKKILYSYGVTEAFCGCPILSSMEVKQIATTPTGEPVYIDKNAAEADGIIPVNRIKPHTDFQYTYESGLMKILTIGMGKQKGAEICHSWGPDHLAARIEMIANLIMENANILFGVGTVENAYDQTCILRALTPEEIKSEEPKILLQAYNRMAQIYFKNIDVLVVDEIGKEISGSGADPNITGHFATNCVKPGMVNASKRVYLDLTEETDGNAVGIGMCDITTLRAVEKVDFGKTFPNSITSTILSAAMIPLFLKNQREAIKCGIYSCNCRDQSQVKLVRIKNTMNLGEIEISEALLDEALRKPAGEILSEPEFMRFDASGNLFSDAGNAEV